MNNERKLIGINVLAHLGFAHYRVGFASPATVKFAKWLLMKFAYDNCVECLALLRGIES